MESIDFVWKANIESHIFEDEVKQLSSEITYLLNTEKDNLSLLESYISQIANFHHPVPEKKVTFSLMKLNKLSFCKGRRFPAKTCILPIFDEVQTFLFSPLDLETYKYKDLLEENTVTLLKLATNSHIVFDDSMLCGQLSTTVTTSAGAIRIHIWNELNDKSVEIYSPDALHQGKLCDVELIIDKELLHPSIAYSEKNASNDLIKKIIYNTNEQRAQLFLSSYIGKTEIISPVVINFMQGSSLDILRLVNLYGESFVDDILPFHCNDNVIESSNRFYRNQLIKAILSKDVCHWIINECESNSKWSISMKRKDEQSINIEKLPSVMSFVLFVTNFWVDLVRKFYCLPRNVGLDVCEIIVKKVVPWESCINGIESSSGQITINVQLNDPIDFENKCMQFEEDSLCLQQGDLLMYNSKRIIHDTTISVGVKYNLMIVMNMIIDAST